MAYKIDQNTVFIGPSSDYPRGKFKERTETEAGTQLGDVALGDFIQFFKKLLIDAGITENELPDNVTNGYQYIEALRVKIQITDLIAERITSGLLSAARIPGLDANKIISGILSDSRIPKSTDGEAQDGNINVVFMTPKSSAYAHRNKGRNLIDGETYNIEDGVGLVVIPNLVSSGIIRLPNPLNYKGHRIRIVGQGGTNVSVRKFDDTELTSSWNTFYIGEFDNSGTDWIWTKYESVVIACPYVYINGLFVNEILRNQIFKNNYKVDTIDITNSVKIGKNIIELSEEKQEETYIDYLHLIIDNVVVKKFFNKKRTMNYGTQFRFEFEIPEKFNKVEVSAKGYYIPL